MGKYAFLKNKQVLTIFAFGVLLLTQYTNCSTYQEDSFYDAPSEAVAVDSSTSRLFAPSSGLLIEPTDNMMVVGGECTIAYNTQSYIELRLVANNGQNTPFRVREDGTCTTNPTDPECFRVRVSCSHGRYYANMPVGGWVPSTANGCSYFIRGQLVTIENGVEKRENKNMFNQNVTIFGADSACP